MGLFNLFKSKPIQFERKCIINGPEYINGKFQDIPQNLMDLFRIKEKEYVWTRQIVSSKNNTKFKISFSGEKKDSLITGKNGLPSLVSLVNVDDDEQILIFDGAIHGYNAVFWEEFPEEINGRKLEQDYNHNGQSEFEIIVLVRYSQHIKEDFDEDISNDGFAMNNRNEKLGKDAFSNGYDSIEIYGFGADGKKIEILAEETA
tara:strand:+ start:21 stop:629 length:609 start_codon:yes stop_codon:yes gene_type:complete